ncbi:72b9beee-0ecf-4a71-9a89-9a73d14acd34 [Sclerotinia trifoliorum]|uniref:72b9beee-0ecf-4a71-9a89-9a73d14acd34 n=1 Tax=Sclerotinia trifoliorum TaxID=28548 RepID=A0A8H2VTJ3_9HELO|nr:72b9beee-0ecf-4a71-9a89-9a73d14acd34 [Sclerotinia trifoliorum]
MEFLSLSSSLIIVCITWALSSQLISYLRLQRCKNSDVPLIGNSWWEILTCRGLSGKELLVDAYRKYSKNGKAFRMNGALGPQWALPTSVFAQAGKMGTTDLDPYEANEDFLLIRPFLSGESEDLIPFITKLTRSIPEIIPLLLLETSTAFRQNFAPEHHSTEKDQEGWTRTCLYAHVNVSLARIVSRILCGEKYSSDEAWVDNVATFARGIFFSGMLLRRLPRWCHRFVAPWMGTSRQVAVIESGVTGDVLALVGGDVKGESYERGVLLPMLVEDVRGKKRFEGKGDGELVWGVHNRICRFFFATVDTTTLTFTHVLYDVIGHRKELYVEPMRKEIRDVWKKFGGVWNRESLGELKSLDAFMRESQRLHPLGYTLGSRKVARREGLDFVSKGEDGEKIIHIPFGERIEGLAWAIHQDDVHYDDPGVFNGFRTRDESIAGSNPSEKFMSFGYGRHACPGRHVALAIEKVMLIEFLMNYDWKEMDRLKDWSFGYNNIPDMASKVHIRRLSEEEVKKVWE